MLSILFVLLIGFVGARCAPIIWDDVAGSARSTHSKMPCFCAICRWKAALGAVMGGIR